MPAEKCVMHTRCIIKGEGHKKKDVTGGRQPSKTSFVYSSVGEVSSRVGERGFKEITRGWGWSCSVIKYLAAPQAGVIMQMATAALCLLSLKSKAVSRDKQDRRKEIKVKVSSSIINTLWWLKGSGRSLSNKLQHIP